MAKTRIELEKEPEVENPLFLEGLAGIGHIGRNCVSYLADHLEAEKIGELHSHHFPPYTIVHDDKTINIIKNDIYQLQREDKEDLILLEGNAQASTPEGHYEVAEKILGFADKVEANEIITLGGYGKGDVVEDPEVLGVTTKKEIQEEYEGHGIKFDHDVGQIVGASGLLLGLGKDKGYNGICLLGETPGFLMSDPKATESVLKVIEDILDEDIDYSKLDEKVEESQEILKKLKNLQQQQGQGKSQDQDQGQGQDLGYIG
ncbi:MAG: proteasome assembly chaperone family protein [Candidatus Nanohaloarchaea archaeon]